MKTINDLKEDFKHKNTFDQALTHKSLLNENKGSSRLESNERLEFLGDAVLELVVTDYIYKKLPQKEEGYLTALRANIVNTKNLANFAKRIDLGKQIYLGKGEEITGGRENSSLLANCVEAIIGAIYIDQGLDAAKNFIIKHILSDFDEKIKEPLKDPKSTLQEYSYSHKMSHPKYITIKETGPANEKQFTVEVQIGEKTLGIGVGSSKQEAQQKAAEVALKRISG